MSFLFCFSCARTAQGSGISEEMVEALQLAAPSSQGWAALEGSAGPWSAQNVTLERPSPEGEHQCSHMLLSHKGSGTFEALLP